MSASRTAVGDQKGQGRDWMPWHRHRLFCVSGSPAEHEDGRNSEPHEDHGRHGEVNIRPAGLRTPRRQGAEADRSPRCRHTRRQPDWKQPERRTQRLHHACGRQEDSHADHLGYHERRGGRQPQLSRKPGLMVGGLREEGTVRMAGGSSGIAHRWGSISHGVTMSDLDLEDNALGCRPPCCDRATARTRSVRLVKFGLNGHTTARPWSLESTIPADQEPMRVLVIRRP